MWKYNQLNKRNERICQEQGIDESRRDEFKNVGNDSPLFRYAFVSLNSGAPLIRWVLQIHDLMALRA